MRFNRKKIVVALAAIAFIGGAAAQDNLKKGIEFLDAKMYKTANAYFLEAVKQSPMPDSYYQLGESYLMLEKVDSAVYYFTQSGVQDPAYYLDEVGLGKVKLKEKNTAAAAELFDLAMKKDRKNPDIYIAIAKAYSAYGMYDKANEMIQMAFKAKKNYPEAFVAEGDIFFAEKKYNEAIGKYEQAIHFDPNNKGAMLRNARVYIHINKDLSLNLLNKIVAVDPQYYPAYVEFADYYSSVGKYEQAIESYEKFINLPGIEVVDWQNYAAALYFTKQYDKSLEEVRRILAKDPTNFVMRRIQMYNDFEKEDQESAYTHGNEFFGSKKESDKYIAIDYDVFGRILEAQGETTRAIEMFTKAAEIDSSRVDLYKKISETYDKAQDYPNAIAAAKLFLAKAPEPNAADFYSFGRLYYNAISVARTSGSATELEEYVKGATQMFDSLIVHNPDHYIGYLFKARTIAQVDTEFKGPAKEAYEAALAKLNETKPENDRAEKNISTYQQECYLYLGNYYLTNEDKVNARENFEKILILNPNNESIREFIKSIK